MAPIPSKEVAQMAGKGLKHRSPESDTLGQGGFHYNFFSHFETNGSEGTKA